MSINIGDIFEVETKVGKAYIQYAKDDKEYGQLIRVFGRVFPSTPPMGDLKNLVEGPEDYYAYILLKLLAKEGTVLKVGSLSVPKRFEEDLPFKSPALEDPKTGEIPFWWIIKGSQETRVKKLSAAEKKFPTLGIINIALLKDRIEKG